MRVEEDLPSGVFDGLPTVHERDRKKVLIPVSRLHLLTEVDALTEDLSPLISAHLADVGLPSQPFLLAVSELAGNAVEHGQSKTGCYVAAQRYTSERRLCMSIADLGIGVPEHVRQRYPEWTSDGQAIENATLESVSGTGNEHRGYGFSQVLEEVAESEGIARAEVLIRSGRGMHRVNVNGTAMRTRSEDAPYKRGTWISVDISTA